MPRTVSIDEVVSTFSLSYTCAFRIEVHGIIGFFGAFFWEVYRLLERKVLSLPLEVGEVIFIAKVILFLGITSF